MVDHNKGTSSQKEQVEDTKITIIYRNVIHIIAKLDYSPTDRLIHVNEGLVLIYDFCLLSD